MISNNNPTPLEFFRFITPTHKSRAIEKYGKCLDEAIDFCEDSDKQSKLRNLKETINVYNQICFTYSILYLQHILSSLIVQFRLGIVVYRKKIGAFDHKLQLSSQLTMMTFIR